MEENFFFVGTLKENIAWRLPTFDEIEAKRYAHWLKLYKDFPMLGHEVLGAKIKAEQRASSSLIKKIALLRILLRKPKVVILKDTDEFVDSVYIT